MIMDEIGVVTCQTAGQRLKGEGWSSSFIIQLRP